MSLIQNCCVYSPGFIYRMVTKRTSLNQDVLVIKMKTLRSSQIIYSVCHSHNSVLFPRSWFITNYFLPSYFTNGYSTRRVRLVEKKKNPYTSETDEFYPLFVAGFLLFIQLSFPCNIFWAIVFLFLMFFLHFIVCSFYDFLLLLTSL